MKAEAASSQRRIEAIDSILSAYREDRLRSEPETASLSGNKRYNDRLSDLSPSAENARLARGQTYILRLSEVDKAGLPESTRVATERLLNTLIEEQQNSATPYWQRPIDQLLDLHKKLIALTEKLPFDTIKDYDDYVVRLNQISYAFSQGMTNLQLSAEAGRVLPPAKVEKLLAQIRLIAAQSAEASPFASPLKRFPHTISSNDQERIRTSVLDTISSNVLPSYQRLERFVITVSGPKH